MVPDRESSQPGRQARSGHCPGAAQAENQTASQPAHLPPPLFRRPQPFTTFCMPLKLGWKAALALRALSREKKPMQKYSPVLTGTISLLPLVETVETATPEHPNTQAGNPGIREAHLLSEHLSPKQRFPPSSRRPPRVEDPPSSSRYPRMPEIRDHGQSAVGPKGGFCTRAFDVPFTAFLAAEVVNLLRCRRNSTQPTRTVRPGLIDSTQIRPKPDL